MFRGYPDPSPHLFPAGLVLIPLFSNHKLVAAKRSGVLVDREDIDQSGWW